jgi:hypothetical protein
MRIARNPPPQRQKIGRFALLGSILTIIEVSSGAPINPVLGDALQLATEFQVKSGLGASLERAISEAVKARNSDNINIITNYSRDHLKDASHQRVLNSGLLAAASYGDTNMFNQVNSIISNQSNVSYVRALAQSLELASKVESHDVIKIVLSKLSSIPRSKRALLVSSMIKSTRCIIKGNFKVDLMLSMLKFAREGLLNMYELWFLISNSIVEACDEGRDAHFLSAVDFIRSENLNFDPTATIRRGFVKSAISGRMNMMQMATDFMNLDREKMSLHDLERCIRSAALNSRFKILQFILERKNHIWGELCVRNVLSPLIDELVQSAQCIPLLIMLRCACLFTMMPCKNDIRAAMINCLETRRWNVLRVLVTEGGLTLSECIKCLQTHFLAHNEQLDIRLEAIRLIDFWLCPNPLRKANLASILKRAERIGDFDVIRQVIIFLSNS